MRRLLLAAFIWGWSFLFIRVVVEGAPPAFVAAGRIAIGAVVMLAALSRRRERLPRDRRTWMHLCLVAATYAVIPFTMLAAAEQDISSALASLLNASTPLFTATLAIPLLRERLTALQAVGLVVAFAGVGLLSGVGGEDVAASSTRGIVLVLGVSLCYGFSFCWVRRHLQHVAPLVLSAGQMAVAAVLASPLAVVAVAREGIELTAVRLLCLVLLGAFGTGVAVIINYRVIAEHGATTASLVTFLVPVVAVAVGVVVLDEPFSARLVVGGMVVLAGVAMVQWRAFRDAREARRLAPLGETTPV